MSYHWDHPFRLNKNGKKQMGFSHQQDARKCCTFRVWGCIHSAHTHWASTMYQTLPKDTQQLVHSSEKDKHVHISWFNNGVNKVLFILWREKWVWMSSWVGSQRRWCKSWAFDKEVLLMRQTVGRGAFQIDGKAWLKFWSKKQWSSVLERSWMVSNEGKMKNGKSSITDTVG